MASPRPIFIHPVPIARCIDWTRNWHKNWLSSARFRAMRDFQRGWYKTLLLEIPEAKPYPGYLPLDANLWEIAGAHSRLYFESRSRETNGEPRNALVLACFETCQIAGKTYIYHPRMLEELIWSSERVSKSTNPQSTDRKKGTSSSLSKQLGLGVAFQDLDDLEKRIDRLFEKYCQLFRRNPSRYRLTDQRRKKAESRFMECLEMEHGNPELAEKLMLEAMQKLALSDWHVNTGNFDWIDHLFDSAEVFQKRLEMVVEKKHGPQQAGTDRTAEAKEHCWYEKCKKPFTPGTGHFGFCSKACMEKHEADLQKGKAVNA